MTAPSSPISCARGLGLAAFVIPIVLFGWSLRLLLDRPLRSLWRKLALLPVALVLAALALSVLDQAAFCAAPGCGGAVGWELQRLLALAGFVPAALPIGMMAAAGLGLSLLLILGLSWRDWRDLGAGAGNSAGRVAVLSGRGTVAAAGFGGRLLRRWWRARSGDGDGTSNGVRASPQGGRHAAAGPPRTTARRRCSAATCRQGARTNRFDPLCHLAAEAANAGQARGGRAPA